MDITVNSYDTRIDAKRRLTLRHSQFEYYHVEEYADGKICLFPRVLVEPFSVSANTLKMMDSVMENLEKNTASEPIDLSEFEG